MSTDRPTERHWNYEAYAAIPNDGKRHEIVAGDHFMNPAPSLYHQQISRHLQFQLNTAIELADLGFVINAPVDVQLGEFDIVQPDLVIITKERQLIMTPTKVKGIPDLIIEILSPSNRNHDLVTKRKAYLRCGVPEYWIVSPDEHSLQQLKLIDGQYDEQTHSESITMAMPPHTPVDLAKVW